MRRIAVIVLVGGAALAQVQFNTPRVSVTQPASDDLRAIRVVNWNIDRGTEVATIARELEREPADLYFLQEVDCKTKRANQADIAAELAKDLHMNFSFGIEFEELSQEAGHAAYIGQATLTRLPIKTSRIIRFQRQSGFWKPRAWLHSSVPLMQRRLGSRIALVNELEFAGRPLVVYNLHLESRSMGLIQAAQIDEIFEDLKRYPANTPVILAGDLNSKYFPSIFLHKLENAGFQSATGERIERTHTIMMALDWMFARGPIKLDGGKIRKDLSGSDHYPIYARLVALN